MQLPSREADATRLRRAIHLAMNGRGGVEPNPMVGCVIVNARGHVIGEGYHATFGEAHAEPIALGNCTESPAGATVYVTLEPCCHASKKTPPCVPRLIDARIARVVIGCLDPNPEVDGKGAALLRDAGVQVDLAPVQIQASCNQLLAPFIARTRWLRPYVTLKWAESSGRQMAGRSGGGPVHITNPTSDRVVHALRSRCDAIAVGTNTVLNDDPLLTARGVDTKRTLRRVVFSNSLKISAEAKLVATAREHPLIVYSSESSVREHAEIVAMLKSAGAEIVALPVQGVSHVTYEGRFSLNDALRDLHARSVTHLVVEPGPTLARAMLARGQADRVWVFRSPKEISRSETSTAPEVEYPMTGSIELNGDVLTEYLNPSSDVFFTPEPSADFELTRAKPRD